MIDCLIIGFNDSNFEDYVTMVKAMGTDSGAYRDLRLAYIDFQGKPYRSMDILNHFYSQGVQEPHQPFHNADFLWPVVTYLGSYLSKRGFTFDYVNLFHLEKDKLKEKLQKNDILTIAITTTLYVTPHPVLEVISFIRQYNQTAKILVGGPYISNQPKLGDEQAIDQLFKYLDADIYIISSEGEGALVDIINALKNNESLDEINNIAFRQGNHYRMTPASTESNPLEENMVDYTLFPKEEIAQFVTLRTAKSCPFSCSFCGFPQRAGKYKYMSVELVENELNALRDIGTVTTLTFLDDTFNVPKERFKEILRMMIKNDYGFKWNSFYRSDHGDEETIELMGRAGCEGVFLGIESGSDEMLQKMNKSARRNDYLKAIPLLRDAGVSTHANLIVGFPGETYDTVQESISLIEEAKPDFFRAQLWYADPVTPIWKKKDEYGVKGSSFNWSHETMDYQTACDWVDHMFLAIEGSIWLPQNGFEQWSTFYLQRKGMKMDQIKTFLKCFNAVIKESLIFPHKKEMSPKLLASLRESAQFNEPNRSGMRPIEIFSGRAYVAAEQFWLNEFSDVSLTSKIEAVRDSETEEEEWATLPCAIEKSLLAHLATQCQETSSAVVLAAYSLLLMRLSGQKDAVVVVIMDDEGEKIALPLKIKTLPDMTFRELLQAIRIKMLQAMEHGVHALHILTNPLRVSGQDQTPPVFDVGFVDLTLDESREGTLPIDLLNSLPKGCHDLRLLLYVESAGADIGLKFAYPKSWFRSETIEKLSTYLTSILKDVDQNPNGLLHNLGLDKETVSGVSSTVIDAHASEFFNF